MNLNALQEVCALAIANSPDVVLTSVPAASDWVGSFIQLVHSEYGSIVLRILVLGTFFGIVSASVSATIARVRYKRSAWALVYSSAGAFLFWLGAIIFAWQEFASTNYPVLRALYGSGSQEHLIAVREASIVLTLLMFAPAIGATIGVLLTPKTLRKRKPKMVL